MTRDKPLCDVDKLVVRIKRIKQGKAEEKPNCCSAGVPFAGLALSVNKYERRTNEPTSPAFKNAPASFCDTHDTLLKPGDTVCQTG